MYALLRQRRFPQQHLLRFVGRVSGCAQTEPGAYTASGFATELKTAKTGATNLAVVRERRVGLGGRTRIRGGGGKSDCKSRNGCVFPITSFIFQGMSDARRNNSPAEIRSVFPPVSDAMVTMIAEMEATSGRVVSVFLCCFNSPLHLHKPHVNHSCWWQ